jgi:hypothetical protein
MKLSRRLVFASVPCAVVGVVAAIYTIVYLYRWEWHRATIAICFVIATEIPLATMLVLARLRAIEAKIDRVAAATRDRVADVLHDNPNPPRRHFAWLERSSGQMGVFVPMLLGMGTILSGLAWVVDHVARRVGHTTGDRRLAARLRVFALPEGGFLPSRREPTACDD